MSVDVPATVVGLLDPIFGGRVGTDRGLKLDPPNAIVLDHLNETSAQKGDAQVLAWDRLFQVDVWQSYADEDPTLVDQVIAVLDGAKVPGGFGIRVSDSQRVPDTDANLIHIAITCRLARLR